MVKQNLNLHLCGNIVCVNVQCVKWLNGLAYNRNGEINKYNCTGLQFYDTVTATGVPKLTD